jgi:hypothetical protein
MYQIKKENYGFKLVFKGMIHKDEMENWKEDSIKKLRVSKGKFGNIIDMRELKALQKDTQVIMEEGQKLYKEKGMERSAVILNSAIVTMQFKKIAKETGIDKFERYINASANTNWEELAINWVKNASDINIK